MKIMSVQFSVFRRSFLWILILRNAFSALFLA